MTTAKKDTESEWQGVSFRLDTHHYKLLVKQAARYNMKPAAYARQALIETLDHTQGERIEQGLETLSDEVTRLRSNLADAIETLLVNTLPDEQEESARRWVETHLRE